MNIFLTSVAIIFVIGFFAGRLTVSAGASTKRVKAEIVDETASVEEEAPVAPSKTVVQPNIEQKVNSQAREQELLNQIASMNQPCPSQESFVPGEAEDPEAEDFEPDIPESDVMPESNSFESPEE